MRPGIDARRRGGDGSVHGHGPTLLLGERHVHRCLPRRVPPTGAASRCSKTIFWKSEVISFRPGFTSGLTASIGSGSPRVCHQRELRRSLAGTARRHLHVKCTPGPFSSLRCRRSPSLRSLDRRQIIYTCAMDRTARTTPTSRSLRMGFTSIRTGIGSISSNPVSAHDDAPRA